MDSQFSGTVNWSQFPVQNFWIPTANLLVFPGPLFCLVLSLPNYGINYFLTELKIPIF